MWCSLCRADVSVRTTGHAGGLLCSRCGHDLLAASRPTDTIRQAREILERWNSSDLFERISRTESLDSLRPRNDIVKKPDNRMMECVDHAIPPKLDDADIQQTIDVSKTQDVPEPGDIVESAARPPAEYLLNAPIESEAGRSTTDTNAITVTKVEQQLNLSELAHVDVLNVTTTACSPVTGQGITNELQRVMDLATARESELRRNQMSAASESEARSPVNEETDAGPENTTDPAQSVQSVPVTGADSQADSELSPEEPADTANVSKLESAAVPKKITRSSMRRPLLHRRFPLERPATLSSTGSENVNRNLRVDQPGGKDSVAETNRQGLTNASSVAPETKIVSNSPSSGRRFRVDAAEAVDRVTNTDGRRGRTQTLPKHRYIDEAHDAAMRGPHFEVTAPRRSNLTSIMGQFLAYLGVLGLTIGTAMVIYGHFGGYSEYTPTGWLVTTVAQMLLFLGVINLVSGGLEQNNDDVSRRINILGEQLLRIEQVTSNAMRGPKLPAHLYENPDAGVEDDSRQPVGVQRD